ncbi:MAG TPA: hypothetical protein VNA69_19000 [Thermoanaerobaculia bacterium]|nr:hypothetical protein [Thermoanaerobaculia bacterium]
MTINTNVPKPAAVTADGQEPLTPEQIVEQLRMLREHVPDFGPLSVPDAASLRRTAHVDADFTQEAINTLGASPSVAGALRVKAEAVAAERDAVSRWSAVEAELRAMLQGVAAANLSRRHRVGLTTLQTYSIARQLMRSRDNADLMPHVAAMRRVNKFGRRRRNAPQPVAPAPPAPPLVVPQSS